MLSSEQQAKLFPLRENLGELMRKMFNRRSYRAHNSPHEMLQAISYASDKRFNLGRGWGQGWVRSRKSRIESNRILYDLDTI